MESFLWLNPEYDEDGNVIGGDYNPVPDNGTLWFDERQGRLFTWIDDGWYQTNGGDGLPHMGEAPPETEVPGILVQRKYRQSVSV